MSVEINEFINGQEPQIPLGDRVRNQLLNQGIQNFSIRELSNGAIVVQFQGTLQPGTSDIMTENGFRGRTGNLGGDVIPPSP
jgi:hypothetical protein